MVLVEKRNGKTFQRNMDAQIQRAAEKRRLKRIQRQKITEQRQEQL